MVKLLKFRSLNTQRELKRAKEIVETGEFWCSKLWNLNDPMEGVYRNSEFNQDEISAMFSDKNSYVICSFSDNSVLENPTLWGYYANGFKGIAIEIDVPDCDVIPVDYLSSSEFKIDVYDVKRIITRKLDFWKHEREYRFLVESMEEIPCKIGTILNIYVGTPFANLNNRKQIEKHSSNFKKYNLLKKKFMRFCNEGNIPCKEYIF